jgi:hypothetical protein
MFAGNYSAEEFQKNFTIASGAAERFADIMNVSL